MQMPLLIGSGVCTELVVEGEGHGSLYLMIPDFTRVWIDEFWGTIFFLIHPVGTKNFVSELARIMVT
jgi:hypothetical protein